ncbi:FecR family protein [Pedobacter africanus]|uniref:FecR family protein n=1 Tax=Pedobacter africanus TaxID=151894 RepID=A0A1W2CU86_9SPHI|nr:FecR family protein [Pedobacter africanus]SMC88805.1 FecR family protein [Pedobacter africanus]
MDQQRLDYLHKGYLNDSLNKEEREQWGTVLQSREQEEPIKILMEQTWHGILPEERISISGSQSDLFFNQIIGKPELTRVKLWPRIAVAASIAFAIGVGSLLYINKDNRGNNQQTVQINDVDPGKMGATLTLASGKKIRLDDAVNGELTNEAGVSITKTKDGQLIYELKETGAEHNKFNTLSTSNGETYQVRLPDGSAVWLNAASSLTYSANLIKNGKRSVTLSGEAYFQVAKDKSHSFVVSTAGQQIEVLGTHFNVNAYPDEPITATTLVEGSVKVSSGSHQKMLKPGYQAKNNGKDIRISKANIESVTDWKDGEFNLDETDFRVAMRKIARWYDVEVIYDKSVPEDIEAWGWIPRDSKLSSILKLIENSGQVKFRLEGKKVYVYK